MDHLFNDDTSAPSSSTTIRTATIKTTLPPTKSSRCSSASPIETARRAILKRLLEADFVTPVGLRTISTADAWYFPSHGFGLLGGVWPDLTLWFAVALARNGSDRRRGRIFSKRSTRRWKPAAARNTVPGRVRGVVRRRLADQSRHVPLAVDRREVSVGRRRDGRRSRRLSHQRPPASRRRCVPQDGSGRRRARALGRQALHLRDRSAQRQIFGDMPRALGRRALSRASTPGRDVSDEVTTSPVEVGAIAFEDDDGARADLRL